MVRLLPALAAALLLAGPVHAQEVRPGDDFDAFANGDWYRDTALPDGQLSYGTTARLRERAPFARWVDVPLT